MRRMSVHPDSRAPMWKLHRLWPALIAVVAVALFTLAACDDDGSDGGEATPTQAIEAPSPTATTPATEAAATTIPTQDIRNEDFSTQPSVQELLEAEPRQRTLGEVVYADLTGDGAEEAVVHVESGGTGGVFNVFVFGYVDGELQQLLSENQSSGGHMVGFVESGQLIVQWPIYNEGDTNIGPTGGLSRHFYDWDGASFVIEREEVIDLEDIEDLE